VERETMSIKTHVIFFDGTRNGLSDEFPTNIQKMFHAAGCHDQIPQYYEGPGDEDTCNWIEQITGGAFGLDCDDIRDQALEDFFDHYKPGDRIAVFGFSRGAAIARLFASRLTKAGIEIDFLGCFDTVMAQMPFLEYQQKSMFGDLHVSPLVKRAVHFVAIDEKRKAFIPNLMNARPGVEEIWFRGDHCDIGGGHENTGLSDITLEQMVIKAGESQIYFEPIKTQVTSNMTPHKMETMLRYGDRRVGVKVGDKWCHVPVRIDASVVDRPAQFFPENEPEPTPKTEIEKAMDYGNTP